MKSIKLLGLFIFAVLLISNVSYSQNNSLPGGPGRFEALGSNPFILDPVNDMNSNPAWSNTYKNYVFANIGRNSVNQNQLTDQYAGVNFGIGAKKNMNLGLVLNKSEDQYGIFAKEIPTTNGGYVFNVAGTSAPIVPLKVLFGFSSTNLQFAIAPYYSAWSSESDSIAGADQYKSTLSSSSIGTQLGMIYKMNGDWIEVSADVKLNSFKYEGTAPAGLSAKLENEGGMHLGIGARGWFNIEKNAKVKLVPFVSFDMFSWNGKVTTTPVAYTDILPKYSYMNIAGGLGINMPILEKGTLATGLSVGYHSENYKREDVTAYDETYSLFTLPKFNISAEWFFTEWLSGRLGYSRAVINSKDDVKYNAGSTAMQMTLKGTSPTDADQTITTGLGLHFERFSFDGMIGERFFKEGPNVLTGKQNDLYGVISASYNFNR
jgi:hypothetical protein